MEQPALLEMRDITKEFPGVKALDGVSLTVRPGTVHALMGENGAGKSTLMKCLFGIYAKDSGTIILDGKEVDFKNSREALENGVAMVHQELNQALTRSVMDNLWLGRYPTKKYGPVTVVDHAKMYKDTEELLKKLKAAGVKRYHCNLETASSYFSELCTTHTIEQKKETIRTAQELGMEICSGGIIGMGESKEDVVDMLLELKEINPEALPINFLLPIKGTPLGDADTSGLTTEYCLKVLCLARLLVPQSDIRCAAGREVYFKGQEKKLLSVVDSIFASGYLTEGGQSIQGTLRTITDAGFTYEIESA